MNCNILEKANQLVCNAKTASLGLIDEAGFPTVSTISSIQATDIYKIYFSTGTKGNKALRIAANPAASVCYQANGDNVTLVGKIAVLTDTKTKHALWQDWFVDHFPLGKDDPGYCILAFVPHRASLWIDQEEAYFDTKDIETVQSRCGLLCHSCAFIASCGCEGCIPTMGKPFHGTCPIAACCQEKGYTHCGQCHQMPCAQLEAYSCKDLEHGDKPAGARLQLLRHWATLPQK